MGGLGSELSEQKKPVLFPLTQANTWGRLWELGLSPASAPLRASGYRSWGCRGQNQQDRDGRCSHLDIMGELCTPTQSGTGAWPGAADAEAESGQLPAPQGEPAFL